MAVHFDESTDRGKLYLNYPMLESYKDLKSVPDPRFLERTVGIQEIASYKADVAERSI